jgi:hypothetical protein
MRSTVLSRRWQASMLLSGILAAAGVPVQAYDIDRAALQIAIDSISDDTQQDAEESPGYVAPDAAAAQAAQDPALATRRANMIQQCEDNNGVDCATQVDTELGAELMEQGGVKHIQK